MRRRKSRSSGAKPRRSELRSSKARPGRSPVSTTRRDTPRRRHGSLQAIPSRRPVRRLSDTTEPSRTIERVRERRNHVPDRLRDRRAGLHAQRRTREGLPVGVMPARRLNENASRRETRPSLCTRKKETRRAVIIATGHGGVNNSRNYKEHKKCR